MPVRIGVDVGGTFTKAVAYDLGIGDVVAQASVATTHGHERGVAHGVVDVVARVAGAVGAANVDLVTHSTTQAVNALLEGDVAVVGIVGMGRHPDQRKARKRTTVGSLDLGSGHVLSTEYEFLDVTGGLTEERARATVLALRDRGARAIAAVGAFAPDDDADERLLARTATDLGLPVTTSAELSGLYGLELRSVTATLNASILPVAAETAATVESGVAESGIHCPVMVMRGDGGATDVEGFRTAPARTLYSGPAASVAGALRSGRIDDGVIIEIGGTSSNIAAIRRGRPALSYVQVGGRVTALRALDVRVLGVAGGSMLRVRRGRVYGVGPRSAHIAGCEYATFTSAADLDGATVELTAPKPADAPDHVVLRLRDGRRVALTNTCATNALEIVAPGDHAAGDREAARAAFALVGTTLRLPGDEVARQMLQASTQAIGDLVELVIKAHDLERPVLVAVGGGAGGLGRAVAGAMGLDIVIPEHAAVISAVGDALSLIRVEREQTISAPTAADTDRLMALAEAEALAAGAGAGSLDVRSTYERDRSTLRVTVTGAVGLRSGAVPGRPLATEASVGALAAEGSLGAPRPVGSFWLLEPGGSDRVVVVDRYGDIVIEVTGEVLEEPDAAAVAAVVERRTRHLGPITIRPETWLISGDRFVHLDQAGLASLSDSLRTLVEPCSETIIVIGRE